MKFTFKWNVKFKVIFEDKNLNIRLNLKLKFKY